MSQDGSLKIIIPSVLKVSRNGEFKGVVIIIILILRQRTKKITRKNMKVTLIAIVIGALGSH